MENQHNRAHGLNADQSEVWCEEALKKVYSHLMSISDSTTRIMYSDPNLSVLHITPSFDDAEAIDDSDHIACCYPESLAEWFRYGDYVGKNSSLKALHLGGGDYDADVIAQVSIQDVATFCSGLKHNRSIESLYIKNNDQFGGQLFKMLTPFLVNNKALLNIEILNEDDGDYDIELLSLRTLAGCLPKCNYITSLRFIECDMDFEGIKHLSAGIRGCTALTKLSLEGVNAVKNVPGFSGEAMVFLTEALSHPSLTELSLSRNDVGRNCCFSLLTTVLENPNSKLRVFRLQDNDITAPQATMLANSLSNNSTLSTLDLMGNKIGTGWNALEKLLCDTTSIESTYLSNHTLQSLGATRRRDGKRPANLTYLLNLNKNGNEGFAAHCKILGNHLNGEYTMSPFVGMEIDVLPQLLTWIATDHKRHWDWIEPKCKRKHLAALHHFFKNMPWLMQTYRASA